MNKIRYGLLIIGSFLLLGASGCDLGKEAGVTVWDTRGASANNNTIEKGALENKLETTVEKGAVAMNDGAVRIKGMEINYAGNEPVIKVLDQYNSPAVEFDKVDVTLYQTQSDKVKITEKYKSYYANGNKKSESEKITEPIVTNTKPSLISSLNLPGWLSTLFIFIFGLYYMQNKHDIIGKIIKSIKWLAGLMAGYWRKK